MPLLPVRQRCVGRVCWEKVMRTPALQGADATRELLRFHFLFRALPSPSDGAQNPNHHQPSHCWVHHDPCCI